MNRIGEEKLMSISQRIFNSMTHLTRSTANKGVEVNEKDIMTNASLDGDTTISTWQADSETATEAAFCEQPRRVAPCVQVVVQKHDGRLENSSAELPELPAPKHCKCEPCRYCANSDNSWQATASSVPSADHTGSDKTQLVRNAEANKKAECSARYATRSGRFRTNHPAGRRLPPARSHPAPTLALTPPQRRLTTDPERVEVYYFECGGGAGYLATTDAAPATRTSNWAARVERAGIRFFAETLAVPQLVAALPLAFLLQLQRSALICVRGVLVGSVQTCSDYLLKPVLTVTFNAVLRPPLVCMGRAFASCRDALRPVAALLADYTEPAVRLVSAMGLVRVQKRYTACRILRKRRHVTAGLQRV